MILFFGTRPGKPEIRQLTNTPCPYCHQLGTLSLSISSNYFHLFWIKLFKISTHQTATCSHCKGVFFEDEFTADIKSAIEQ